MRILNVGSHAMNDFDEWTEKSWSTWMKRADVLSSLLCVHVEAKKMPRVAFVGHQLISVIRCTFGRPIFRSTKDVKGDVADERAEDNDKKLIINIKRWSDAIEIFPKFDWNCEKNRRLRWCDNARKPEILAKISDEATFAVTCFIKAFFPSRFVDYSIFLTIDFPWKYRSAAPFGDFNLWKSPNCRLSARERGVFCGIWDFKSEFLEMETKLTWLASRPRFSNKMRFSMANLWLLTLHFQWIALKTRSKGFIKYFPILLNSFSRTNRINTRMSRKWGAGEREKLLLCCMEICRSTTALTN